MLDRCLDLECLISRHLLDCSIALNGMVRYKMEHLAF
jgi:hypothetical protein